MEWSQVCTLLQINVVFLGSLTCLLLWMVVRLDAKISSIQSDVKALSSILDGHASRIDQLYRMFVDLLKETKNK